jgi:competence protein ComGC
MKTSKQPKYTLIAIVAKVILIISLLFILLLTHIGSN